MSPAEVSKAFCVIRAQMDGYDNSIVQLLQALVQLLQTRAECAERLGRIKMDHRLPIRDPEREKQVLDHVRALAGTGPLSPEMVVSIFERVILGSISVQYSRVCI